MRWQVLCVSLRLWWSIRDTALPRGLLVTIDRHQALTVDSYCTLRQLGPALPFIPVIQGWRLADYRQDGQMVLRWIAAGMDQARKQFRRGNGHLHLPALRAALDATITAVTPSKEDAA